MSGGQPATGPEQAPGQPKKPLQRPERSEGQQGPAGGHTASPAGDGRVVRVVPSLFPEARRRGLMQPMRVWYLLRTFERDASGRLDKRETLDHLRRLGWSQASAYRLISKGIGTFWARKLASRRGKES